MDNLVKFYGKIKFDLEDKTKKHVLQSSWKKTAMVMFDGDDICSYYSWFILKRYSIILNKPLRGSHTTFISDSMKDLSQGSKSIEQVNELWDNVKNKWNGKDICLTFDVSPRFGGEYAWLNVHEEHTKELDEIRKELGLGKPFFKYHLTLGYANEKNLPHLEYIHGLIKKGLTV